MGHQIVSDAGVASAEDLLGVVTGALGGTWRVEGAAGMCRAEQVQGDLRLVLGAHGSAPGEWVVAWEVRAEIPDGPAYTVVFAAVGGAAVAIAVGGWAAGGFGAMLAGPVVLGSVLAVGRRWVQGRLPDVERPQAELGERVRSALASR